MANDYIVRLQGQDNLSGTIRNVQRNLSELSNNANRLDNIERKFRRIDESSAPLKKKLRDVKIQMEQLALSGDTNSATFQRMAQAAQRYQRALDQVNNATRQVTASNGGMLGSLGNLKGVLNNVASQTGFGGIASSLGAIASPAGASAAAIAGVGVVMVKAGKAAADFETHLDGLQSLTGLDDGAMKDISKGAVEMSKEFKSSANDIVDAMKLIGSQAPELLSNKDALMEVTKAANVLSEAAQIEVVDAAKGITTVMNQMGVSASEASNIINVLAASSQQGSADVAYLNTAFEKAGTAAKGAGMSYVELSAAIESIAPKFSSADVAGSQLASTLLKLSMQGNSEFKPSVVGMQQALENLSKAQMDDVAIKNLVGESNVTMLKSLIEAKDTFAGYTQSLAGTNTAYEQMATNTDNLEGAVNKIKSAWEAFLITLGQSGVMQGIADGVMDLMGLLNDIINVISDVISTFDLFGEDVTDNCNISKLQIELLSEVIKGIGEALKIIVAVAAKAFNAIRETATNVGNAISSKWNDVKRTLSDNAFARTIMAAWNSVYNKASEIIGRLKKLWNQFLQWLGLEGKKVATPDKVTGTTPDNGGGTTPPATTPDNGSGGNNKGGTSNKGSKSSNPRPTKKDKPKTKLELDEDAFNAKNKAVNSAVNSYNIGTLTKEQLDAIVKDANAYFEEHKFKAHIDIDYKKDGQGFEKASIKKPDTPKEDNRTDRDKKRDELKKANQMYEQIKKDFADGIINLDEIQGEVDKVNEILKGIGKDPIEIKIDADKKVIKTTEEIAEEAKKNLQTLRDSVSEITDNLSGDVGSMIESFKQLATVLSNQTATSGEQAGTALVTLGSALQQVAGDGIAAKIGATMAAIGQIILGFATATAQASSMGPWAWLAFVGAGLGAVATMIATISSYADGGIIQGSSFHGDNTLARVNAGEMILNQKQQANLFRALDNGGGIGGATTTEIKIKGSDLYLALSNLKSKRSKIQ